MILDLQGICQNPARFAAPALVLSAALGVCSAQAQTSWADSSFSPQSGSFTLSFNATPANNDADVVIGLSRAPAAAYTDLAAIVRFNSSGTIDARNGSAYAAAVSVPYAAGRAYSFVAAVNVPAHSYSLYVTPANGVKTLLASNYAFRTEQAGVATLAEIDQIGTAGNAAVSGVTVSAPPPPAIDCVHAVWKNLEACGWPGPANTGYPAGQTFSKTVNGAYTVTADNTVIDGWRVTGGIQVNAKNVVIRNSWISANFGGGLAVSGTGVISVNAGASADIEHNLLDGQNGTHTCVWHMGASMTAKFNNCQNVNDGMFSWSPNPGAGNGSSYDGGDNFTIANNYFHDFTTLAANGHIDGYQTEGAKNGLIQHNTYNVSQNQDADIAIWDSRTSSDSITINDNLMAGGGFAAYAEDYYPSESSPYGGYSVTNINFTNNKWSTVNYPCVGGFGIWFVRGAPTDGWRRSGNIVLETGQNVDNSDVAGCENPTDVTPPAQPAGLAANPSASTQMSLSWQAAYDNVGVTAYRVERCAGAGCNSFTEIAVPSGAPPAPNAYLDHGLAPGVSYSYRVAAVDLRGNVSPYSAVATQTAR